MFIEKEIKTKWNSCRTYFRKLNKHHKLRIMESSRSGAGAVEVDPPAWAHYESMLFLEDSFEVRRTISNIGMYININIYYFRIINAKSYFKKNCIGYNILYMIKYITI